MNSSIFHHLIGELEVADWQAVVDGQALLMVDDSRLETGPAQAANAILCTSESAGMSPVELKHDSLVNAAEILHNYYLTHPLTLAGFNRQVEKLFEQHGEAAFAALYGHQPRRTLFVEGGEVVAEPPSSPRHRYGVYCELTNALSEAAVKTQVRNWLERGDAHQRYLGMNVCRYNC